MRVRCSECGLVTDGEPGDTHFQPGSGVWAGLTVHCGTMWPADAEPAARVRRKAQLTQPRRRRGKAAMHHTLTAAEIEQLHGQWRRPQ